MKLRTRIVIIVTIAAAGVSFSFQNCSQAKFQATPDDVESNGVTICDPFTNDSSCEPNVTGEIYYLTANQRSLYGSDGVDTYFNHGNKLEVKISLPRLFVPTISFLKGFPLNASASKYILDESNEKLVEYFAMKLVTDLGLKSGENGGQYQLAIISDDGAKVLRRDTGQVIIDNDGTHATRLGCAAQSLSLAPGEKFPLEIQYYQGPRQHIALTLLWRPIGSGDSLSDSLCGKTGVGMYFGPDNDDFSSSYGYGQLLTRGWKVVPSENLNSVRN